MELGSVFEIGRKLLGAMDKMAAFLSAARRRADRRVYRDGFSCGWQGRQTLDTNTTSQQQVVIIVMAELIIIVSTKAVMIVVPEAVIIVVTKVVIMVAMDSTAQTF